MLHRRVSRQDKVTTKERTQTPLPCTYSHMQTLAHACMPIPCRGLAVGWRTVGTERITECTLSGRTYFPGRAVQLGVVGVCGGKGQFWQCWLKGCCGSPTKAPGRVRYWDRALICLALFGGGGIVAEKAPPSAKSEPAACRRDQHISMHQCTRTEIMPNVERRVDNQTH